MKNSLQVLNRIQKFNIDEQRKILTDLLNRQDILTAQLAQLNQSFEEEKEFARNNSGVGDFGSYVKRYMQQRENLESQLSVLEAQIAQVRDVIADMFKEQKTFEIVDKRRTERKEKKEEENMQKTLDEIGTNTYIKNKQ